METKDMTKDARSLLLYLETCATDAIGKVDDCRINDIDREIIGEWKSSKFIQYGRVKFEDVKDSSINWVILSKEAWTLAHKLRKEKGIRMIKNRPFGRVGYTPES